MREGGREGGRVGREQVSLKLKEMYIWCDS